MATITKRRERDIRIMLKGSMSETVTAFVLQQHLAQHSFDPPVVPAGDQRLLDLHDKLLQTQDGWIIVTINANQEMISLLKAVGREELLGALRLPSAAARAENVIGHFAVREAIRSSRTTEKWFTGFQDAHMAVMVCTTLETRRTNFYFEAVELLSHKCHPAEGAMSAIWSTIQFDNDYTPLREST